MFRNVARALGGALVAGSALAAQTASPQPPSCRPAGPLIRVSEIPEGSGVAAARRSPDRLWTHNDSGKPELVALDSKGAVVGRVRVAGARIEDWEAIAVGPCPGGSCLYVGDIGDNEARRHSVTIYRVPEPADAHGTVQVDGVLHVTYPDGANDAETLLVTPAGDVLIVTKGRTGPVGLYRVPAGADYGGGTVTLELVAKPPERGKIAASERITDGDVSPNGTWVALRSHSAVLLYRSDALMAGTWPAPRRIPLAALGEPQGEGVAFGNDGTLYLVGEGGRKSQPGTFGRLSCTF